MKRTAAGQHDDVSKVQNARGNAKLGMWSRHKHKSKNRGRMGSKKGGRV